MGFITSTIVAITDRGLVRQHNEDCFVLGYPKTGQRLADKCRVTLPCETNSILFAVSDGMGGARAGEVAAQITVDTIMKELPRLPPVLSAPSRLEAAVEAANLAVWTEQRVNSRFEGMGATVTAVLIERDRAYIAEVGDSRAYIIRDNRIKQITNDQTVLQALLDSGAITPEAAQKSMHKNMLLQAMGQDEYLQVACSSIRLKVGDIFLLCSDGLSGKVNGQELFAVVRNSNSLDQAAQNLVALAKERGGDDNITIVLAQFEGEALQRHSESLSRSIFIHSIFDPEQEAIAKPKREVRPATYEDWVAMAMVDYYAETPHQRAALMELNRYGDYIVFRKGDCLVFQGEGAPDTMHHYWLVSGRYRVEVELPDGNRQSIALIVPPTDQRTDEEILEGQDIRARVRRQFFTASLAMLHESLRNATIWCEDDENSAIRVPLSIYHTVGEILGSRFLNAVKHS